MSASGFSWLALARYVRMYVEAATDFPLRDHSRASEALNLKAVVDNVPYQATTSKALAAVYISAFRHGRQFASSLRGESFNLSVLTSEA